MTPAPGRPTLPKSSCRRAQQPMICTPYVCCVHATAYANDVVRSAPELARIVSATLRNTSLGHPVPFSTTSGVYRLKCCLTIWKTVRGSWSVSSRRTGGLTSEATSWSNGGSDAVLPSAGPGPAGGRVPAAATPGAAGGRATAGATVGEADGRVAEDAGVGAAARLYCQLFASYSPTKALNGHSATPPLYSTSPENTPFNSSVSLK